jgi:3-deoxy-D-manno-octulosonic-acid transferase
MRVIYNIIIHLFSAVIYIGSIFNHKALLLVKGWKGCSELLKGKINPGDKIIWMHCASLGEFEQGRPLIESIKTGNPKIKIVLTFFSPSGYEIRKNYPGADYICYLPVDTPSNALEFISIVRPSLALFIKYEFWNNYISVLCRENIPLYLVSGIFRPEQLFFKWYGGFFRKILKKFTHFYVQDERSLELLRGIGISDVSVAGDTRFDRVTQIASTAKDLPVIENFRGNEKLFLAGSSWKQDEEIISDYINRYPEKMKWIFAPHEIDRSNIERLERLFRVKVVRYSEFRDDFNDARVMILDNIGMLSSVYRYAYIAEIGGGFGKGIHNILEPACWGIPVMFGPNHLKFREANDLIDLGGAKCFNNYEEFAFSLDNWLTDTKLYNGASGIAEKYISKNVGATKKIVHQILKQDINN